MGAAAIEGVGKGVVPGALGVNGVGVVAGATRGGAAGDAAPSVLPELVGAGEDVAGGGLFHPRRYSGSVLRRTSGAASFCCAAKQPAVQAAPVDGGAELHDPGFGKLRCAAQ